jgi:hypothetical protein
MQKGAAQDCVETRFSGALSMKAAIVIASSCTDAAAERALNHTAEGGYAKQYPFG